MILWTLRIVFEFQYALKNNAIFFIWKIIFIDINKERKTNIKLKFKWSLLKIMVKYQKKITVFSIIEGVQNLLIRSENDSIISGALFIIPLYKVT